MKRTTTSPRALASTAELTAAVEEARDEVGASFERFCLIAGLASMTQMLRPIAEAEGPFGGAQAFPGSMQRRLEGDECNRYPA